MTDGKPFFLFVNNLIAAMGGAEKVAGVIGVSPVFARKFCEDPDRSGKWITLKSLLALLRHAGDRVEEDVQRNLDKLCEQLVAPAKRQVCREDSIVQIEQAIWTLKYGGRPKAAPMACSECGDELLIQVKGKGTVVYVCRTCMKDGKE